MTETTSSNVFLTLDLDTGEKEFFDIEELNAWTNTEQAAFEWVAQLSGQDQGAGAGGQVILGWLGRDPTPQNRTV